MEELQGVINSARSLIDYLERNPNSLISGKPDRPVVEPK
jgi:hypothetical protein